MDLIADFAFRLPVTVICEMLGIPKEEREVLPRARAPAGGCSIPCRSPAPRSTRPTPAA